MWFFFLSPPLLIFEKTAWILSIVAQRAEFRELLHEHGVEPVLFEALSSLDVHKDMFVAMEILAAIANMSACPSAQPVLVEDLEAIPTLVTIANSVYEKVGNGHTHSFTAVS